MILIGYMLLFDSIFIGPQNNTLGLYLGSGGCMFSTLCWLVQMAAEQTNWTVDSRVPAECPEYQLAKWLNCCSKAERFLPLKISDNPLFLSNIDWEKHGNWEHFRRNVKHYLYCSVYFIYGVFFTIVVGKKSIWKMQEKQLHTQVAG